MIAINIDLKISDIDSCNILTPIEIDFLNQESKRIYNRLNKEIGITFEEVCQEIKDSGYSFLYLKSFEIALESAKIIYDALGYNLDFLNNFSSYREAAIAYFWEKK